MPTNSVPGAVVEYISGLTHPTHGVLKCERDTASGLDGTAALKPPFTVVRHQPGQLIRDFEGTVAGPDSLDVTVTAGTAKQAREIGEFILWAGQPPQNRAGIEADGALPLTGHTNVAAWLDSTPVEGRARDRRGPNLEFTYQFRLMVHATNA